MEDIRVSFVFTETNTRIFKCTYQRIVIFATINCSAIGKTLVAKYIKSSNLMIYTLSKKILGILVNL